jgi:hypothetical protein
MQAVDDRYDSWNPLLPALRPMPGQRSLFADDEERTGSAAQRPPAGRSGDDGLYIDQTGQRYLHDFGHHLPGANETNQRILWDA